MAHELLGMLLPSDFSGCSALSPCHCMVSEVILQHQTVSGVERWNLKFLLNLIFIVIYSQTLIWHHCLFATVYGNI